MNYKEALKKAKEIDDTILHTDERFRLDLSINFADGSRMFIRSAFFIESDGWMFISTDHHGCLVYDEDDILSINHIDLLKKSIVLQDI